MSIQRAEAWLRRCNARPRVWFAVFALFLAMQISPWWYSTGDALVYVSMARSMVRGTRVASLGNPQLFLPPGYPLLISPAFLTGDRPFLAVSILHFGIALILMLGVHHWARQRFPDAALLVTGLVMINASLWAHYRRTLSEVAFMAVMIWTVNVLNSVSAPTRRRWL